MINSPDTHTKEVPGLISVVMPSYNSDAFLREAVKSALTQTYEDTELLIIDDGSSDNTPALLKEIEARYAGKVRTFFQSHQGPFPARNLGLSEALGEYVAFLDADDYWEPTFLEELHSAMVETNTEIAYSGWQNVGDGAPGGQPHVPPCYEVEDITLHFLRSCPWPIHAALVRRKLLTAVSGFSERFFTSMDYDLWLRLHAAGAKLTRVPKVLAYYRWHGETQISAIPWRQVLATKSIQADFIRENPGKVAHLSRSTLNELVSGHLRRKAFEAFWRRDLESAHRLLRATMFSGAWKFADLKYLLVSLLPMALFRHIIRSIDGAR